MKTQIINAITKESKVKTMTSKEKKAHEELIAKTKISEEQIEALEQEKETKKISGKQKLKDLGLDDDEINALLGV